MFNKSIAYRLSIYISLSVISVFVAFIVILYYHNQNLVKKMIESEGDSISSEAVGMVKRQIISAQEISKNLSEQILYYAEHGNSDLILNSIMERYEFIHSIYVSIDSLNDFTNKNNHHFLIERDAGLFTFKSSDQHIFRDNIRESIVEDFNFSDTVSWSQVYQSENSDSLMISFYSPIKLIHEETQKVIGSIICELSLKDFNDMINDIKIGENGYLILVSANGTFLTHPKEDWVFNKNIFSIPKKSFDQKATDVNAILDKSLSGSIIAYPEYLDHKKSWVYYTPIIETGWYILVLIPFDELYFPLYLLVLRMLFFAVLGILIIFFIVSYISNKQIQPLSNVTSQLKRFSNFSNESIQDFNEVKMVADSLDSLRDWFEKYKNTQDQEKKLSKQQKQDLLEASEIQMSLIKTDFSEFKQRTDIDLFASYKPSKIVSGDLFDFFFLNDEHLFFSIGDVSGKGISAAFFMSVAQTIIKGSSGLNDPAKIVTLVNKELTTANQHQFFLTLFIGILNIKTGLLKYCNAAHTSTIILKENGEINELNQSHGMPLGLYSDKTYGEDAIELRENDLIFLYTDGVTELQDENKIHLGKDHLINFLKPLTEKSPAEVIQGVETSLEKYKGSAKYSDDITMMSIKFRAKKRPDKQA